MTNWRLVLDVAAWEFRRWFRPRDQIVTFVLSLVIGLGVWGGLELLNRSRSAPVTVAVVGGEGLSLSAPAEGRIQLEPAGERSDSELRRALEEDELGGILTVDEAGGFRLLTQRRAPWRSELEAILTEAKQREAIARLGLQPGELEQLFAPAELAVSVVEGGQRADTATRVTAIGVLVLMIAGVMAGVAFEFLSITGEKQMRVTEQIVTAIGTQHWIDGKILGTALVSLGTLVTYALSAITFVAMSWVVGRDIPLPTQFVSVGTLLLLVPIALAGFLFWNTVFAAIAATIDDPNTSARGSFLMLPALPLALAFFAIGDPDSLMAQVFAIVPLTSPGLLAVRLSMTTVPWWEIPAALVLLVAGVLVMRRAAGKIFGLGILMYGKEPSWREILKWMRAA